MLCSIDINKPTELEFTLQVTGSGAKSIEPRFIIVGPEFAIVCLCKPEKDSIKVQVPKLQGILEPGKYKVKFEVIAGDQIFTPVDDSIELNSPVSVQAKLSTSKAEDKQPKIAVKLAEPKKEVKEQEEVVEEETVEEIVEEEPQVEAPEIHTMFDVDDVLSEVTHKVLNTDKPTAQFSIFKQFKK